MTLDGRIVEYLENGKFICAFVSEDSGNRLHLLNQNSRELNLPQNRIVYFNKEKNSAKNSRDEIISTLQEISEQREALAQTINLDEIWELVSEKPEDTLGVKFLAGLFFGNDPTDDQTAAFLRSVIDHRLYFKYKAGDIHVHSPEKVEQIKLMQEQERQEENFISTNTVVLRQVWEQRNLPETWEDQETTLQILQDYYLFGKETPKHELARKLIKKAQLTGPHDIFHQQVKDVMWS